MAMADVSVSSLGEARFQVSPNNPPGGSPFLREEAEPVVTQLTSGGARVQASQPAAQPQLVPPQSAVLTAAPWTRGLRDFLDFTLGAPMGLQDRRSMGPRVAGHLH